MSRTGSRRRPRRELPKLGLLGWLRWTWRQLTSMKTALVLLFLLALGAVPGSLIPQTGIDPVKVADFFEAHPKLGPFYDKLGMFDVYKSAWFSAIYLLLFISLIGCVVPRLQVYLKALRARPPKPPRNLNRLPGYQSFEPLPPRTTYWSWRRLSCAGADSGSSGTTVRWPPSAGTCAKRATCSSTSP